MNASEKKIFERQQEQFMKNAIEELQDTQNKIRVFFTNKLEKNLKRVFEKTQFGKMSA